MNTLAYYDHRNVKFSDTEISDLISLYQAGKTVAELSDQYKRTPGQIIHWLKKRGGMNTATFWEEMDIYRGSPLFREVVETGEENREKKKEEKKQREKEKEEAEETMSLAERRKEKPKEKKRQVVQQVITQETHTLLIQENQQLKTEIAELKRDVKEILRLMNALYDFESTEQE
jgi:leucyl aminopeptidase